MKLKYLWSFGRFLITVAMSMVGGYYAGLYAAAVTPAQVPLAVLDINQIASSVDPKAPDYKERVAALGARAKAITEALTAQHVIVLDRANIISAPPEAIIDVVNPVPHK